MKHIAGFILGLFILGTGTAQAASVHSVAGQPGGSEVAAGATIIIDAYGVCQAVSNSADSAYFVPWRTADEWQDFRNHPPAGVTLQPCCPATQAQLCGESKTVSGDKIGGILDAKYEQSGYAVSGDQISVHSSNRQESFICKNGAWQVASSSGACDPLPPKSVPVAITCTIAAADDQQLVVTMEDGSVQSWNFKGSEGNVPVIRASFDAQPVRVQVFHKGTYAATGDGTNVEVGYGLWPSTQEVTDASDHGLVLRTEDWTDYDYNDLVCKMSW